MLDPSESKSKVLTLNQTEDGLKSYKIKAESQEGVYIEETIDIVAAPEEVEVVIPAISNDRDNDGVVDSQDNCPDNYNPTQADNDNDGRGNVCDSTPNGGSSTGGGSRRSSSSSSGGSSTGGGSSTIAAVSFVDGKASAAFKEGGELQFTFKGTVYRIIANDITKDELNLTIKNHKVIDDVIGKNESKDFNLNADAIDDLNIKVENINSNLWAFLRLELLPQDVEPTPEPEPEPEPEPYVAPDRERFDDSGYTIVNLDHSKIGKIILLIAIIVLVALLIVLGILKGWFVAAYDWCKSKFTKKPVRGKAKKAESTIKDLEKQIKELKKSLKK
jgi:hypothetical protein